ncbi:MAG: hypothetical protein U9Q82_05320, partial [Chloroflexota bacterium]|nr:hypothetical protein [Chloroflexota bacterium]
WADTEMAIEVCAIGRVCLQMGAGNLMMKKNGLARRREGSSACPNTKRLAWWSKTGLMLLMERLERAVFGLSNLRNRPNLPKIIQYRLEKWI